MEAEITNRITAAAKVFYMLNKTFLGKEEVSTYTKVNVYKTISCPIIFTYGSESWIHTNSVTSRIQAI